MTTASAPAWEVTFLRRALGSSRARIAGRLVLEAPDLDHARRAAEQALTERREQTRLSGESSVWSLGLLRPLTPQAPGTKRYRVTFAQWEAFEDHFERIDVHELELWAANAAGARRLGPAGDPAAARLPALVAHPQRRGLPATSRRSTTG